MIRLATRRPYATDSKTKIPKLFKSNPPVTDPKQMAKRVSDDFKYNTPQGMHKFSNFGQNRTSDAHLEKHMHFEGLTKQTRYPNKTTRSQFHYDLININFISAVKLFVVYVPKLKNHINVRYAKNTLKHATGLIRFNNLYVSALIAKNPQVQILTYYDTTPTPYIEVHIEKKGEAEAVPIYVDCTDKSEVEILKHIQKVFGKVPEQVALEARQAIPKNELFGSATVMNLVGCSRDCMCRGEGQYPCPKWQGPSVVADKRTIGKYLRITELRSDPYGMNVDWEKQKLTEDYPVWEDYKGNKSPGDRKSEEDILAEEEEMNAFLSEDGGDVGGEEMTEEEKEFLKNL